MAKRVIGGFPILVGQDDAYHLILTVQVDIRARSLGIDTFQLNICIQPPLQSRTRRFKVIGNHEVAAVEMCNIVAGTEHRQAVVGSIATSNFSRFQSNPFVVLVVKWHQLTLGILGHHPHRQDFRAELNSV